MPTTLRETGARLGESIAERPTRRAVTLITEGWGSSGYYSRVLLERDGPTVFPIGTQMYLDHPGMAEETDRPERSVKDLAGRIASTPRMVGGDLVAEAEIFEHWRPVIDALAEDIGLSIRAAGDRELGEADGRQGQIVTALTEGISVDFVTKAGRGGKVGELIESARATVKEALASDISSRLNDAGKERWGGRDRYVYVDDYDPDESWAVYSICPEDGERKFVRVTYEVSGTEVSLSLDTQEVRRTTAYVPSTSTVIEAAAGRPTKEATVADNDRLATLEEGLRQLITKQEQTETRLKEAEKQRDDAIAERDRDRETLLDVRAERVVREATIKIDGKTDPVSVYEGLKPTAVARAVNAALGDKLPLAESGKLDEDKLAERAAKAAKAERDYLAENGVNGRAGVSGLGHSATTMGDVDDKELAEGFGRLGMTEKAATHAVSGR